MGWATLSEAVRRLRSGGVVAFPTETVYGLGACAFDAAAVRRVFEIKGRPANNPLIVHVADEVTARAVAGEWPEAAHRLAQAFWPGPLTLVLPRSPRLPIEVTGGAASVAVRCPDHPVALALLRALGEPVVGPSANLSGAVSPTTASHVRESFSEADVPVLDGGACRVGIESTVLSLCGATPVVLRPGAIGADEIGRVLGRDVGLAGVSGAGVHDAMGSPGRLGPHYRPRAAVVVVEGAAASGLVAERGDVVLTASPRAGEGREVAMPHDAAGFAARLYAALREADAWGATRIIVVLPDPADRPQLERALWSAVRERVVRAASEVRSG